MSDLPPELAEKALAADVRNAVQSVANGDQLSSSKRQIFLDAETDSATPEILLKRRRAAILRLYAKGADLGKNLLAEVADCVPSSRAVTRRLTVEAFQHGRKHYAEVYGYNEHNVKKWIRSGKKATPIDLPPLDDPPGMVDWWNRLVALGIFKQRVPVRLLQAAGRVSPAPVPPTGESSPASPSAPSAPGDLPPEDLELPIGSDYASRLSGLHENARRAEARLAAAEKSRDASLIESADRAYSRALERLREYERDAGKILSRNLVNPDEYDFLVSERLGVINRSLRTLPARIATQIGLPPEWFRKLGDQFQIELDRIFDHHARTDYTGEKSFELAAA